MGRFHERHEDDYYKTPPSCTRALLNVETFSNVIEEPACGDGAISEVLRDRGYFVWSSDLVARGYGAQADFLQKDERFCDSLVTNPPYALAEQFLLHAQELGYHKIALLLRLAWLEGEKRRETIFSRFPPIRIHVFSARQTLWKGDDPNARTTGGMAAYAWFVWEKDFTGKPTIDWISREESVT